MYQPLKTTALSPRPWVIGWLTQIGWMNAVLAVLCLLAAGFGLAAGPSFSVTAACFGWLWISFSVVAYGLAHVCLKLHELRIWMDAFSDKPEKLVPPKPKTFADTLARDKANP